MADDGSSNNAEVFVYTEGAVVPQDVVRVRVHPSVTIIPEMTFQEQNKLEEVELCEGLLEIGRDAFLNCSSLKRINIPSTATTICNWAFYNCKKIEELNLPEGLIEIGIRTFSDTSIKRIKVPSTVTIIKESAFDSCKKLQQVELCEGLQSIGDYAFDNCPSLNHIIVPTTVTSIGEKTFWGCKSLRKLRIPIMTAIPERAVCVCTGMFSVELPEDVVRVEEAAFAMCSSLRNIAIHPYTIIDELVFGGCTSLRLLFGTETNIMNALKQRFDNLPIHKMIYYQSYNNMTVKQLNEAITMKKRVLGSNLNPTGNLQDGLDMTPLHIMACSTVQNIELYKVLVAKYPENLITKDKWKALPLLYVVWGNAPDEIVQFLVESYKSIYPNYLFDWTGMLKTLCKTKAFNSIQKLLDLYETSFPTQIIDLNTTLDELKSRCVSMETEREGGRGVSECIFRYLVKYSLADRIRTIGPKRWRDALTDLIDNDDFSFDFYDTRGGTPKGWYDFFTSTLSDHETEYQKLKEATTLIELALWKNKLIDYCQERNEKRRIKKMKIEEADLRKQCRVNCGANIIIEHVLPFLTG